MGKQSTPRQLADHEAMAVLRNVKGSAQKAGLVLELIRGKQVEQALADLQFSRKRLAVDARKLLQSAIANAENNHGLNVDELYVKEAYTGPGMVLKRFRARARGRAAKILKPRCQMTVVVTEKQAKPEVKTETKKEKAAK
jgi:large subunit ribosomal protein L22